MVEEQIRFSDADLAEFKALIQAKLEKAKGDLELIKSAYMNDLNNGTDDTSPTFKAFEAVELNKSIWVTVGGSGNVFVTHFLVPALNIPISPCLCKNVTGI